jgi:hypothetical protein
MFKPEVSLVQQMPSYLVTYGRTKIKQLVTKGLQLAITILRMHRADPLQRLIIVPLMGSQGITFY